MSKQVFAKDVKKPRWAKDHRRGLLLNDLVFLAHEMEDGPAVPFTEREALVWFRLMYALQVVRPVLQVATILRWSIGDVHAFVKDRPWARLVVLEAVQ